MYGTIYLSACLYIIYQFIDPFKCLTINRSLSCLSMYTHVVCISLMPLPCYFLSLPHSLHTVFIPPFSLSHSLSILPLSLSPSLSFFLSFSLSTSLFTYLPLYHSYIHSLTPTLTPSLRRAIEQEKVVYKDGFERLRILKPEIEYVRKVSTVNITFSTNSICDHRPHISTNFLCF